MNSFANDNHAKAWSAKGMAANCESCHGNADQHIKAGGSKETIITFGKGSKRPAEEQNKQCLSCHQKTPALAMWNQGEHKRSNVACASCHSTHKEKNVRAASTCFECHSNVRGEVSKLSHHPVIEGKVTCSDCHNPHGALSHGMIKADSTNQLCYKCHQDKRGPFVFEHAPVEEDCSTCHTPHGSIHSNLLTKNTAQLCKQCHPGPHGAINGSLANFDNPGQGSSRTFVVRGCLNCHSKVHGTNGPGPYLTR